jgi:acyl-CoA synthetase (AMP-forming)/AMP-acid ligase II
MPDKTKAVLSDDGWFKTGDMVKCDEDGYYFIVDRKNDMILSGGYNVYPREIEEVLYTNPKVLEAAVIGIKDKEKGEIPKAYITLKADVQADPEEIVAFCKERMAGYKLPRTVEIVKELPKNPTGKILKRVIRDEWNK